MILMITIGSLFFLLGVIGIIIQYTSIGNIRFKRDQEGQGSLLSSFGQNSQQIHVHRGDKAPNFVSKDKFQQQVNSNKLNNSDESKQQPKSDDISKIDLIEKKQKWAALLLSFSLTYNLKKLVYRQRPKSNTDVLDGVRVLSIFWVIYGHSYIIVTVIGARNLPQITTKYTHQFLFTAIIQGVYAVDVFFFLSAFLGAYVFLKKYPKNRRCMNPLKVVIAYFHRYYRLTPLLAFTLYFTAFVIYPMASGPGKMFLYNNNVEMCKNYGWRQIVYVANVVGDSDKQCFGWGWYLSNDMQMFLILPWIVILYKSVPLVGIIVLLACFLANFIVTGIISWENDLGVDLIHNAKNFGDIYYVKPWIRVTPYLVGIAFAMMYQNFRDVEDYQKKLDAFHAKYGKRAEMNEIDDLKNIRLVRKGFGYYAFNAAKKSTLVAWIYFLLGFAITFVMVFVMFDQNVHDGKAWTKTGKTIYNIFARGIFTTGLSFILIPLMIGRMKMLRDFLSCEMFSVMAKITYSVYLIHQALLGVFFSSSKSLPYITHLEAVITFFSFLILSYMIGGLFSLLVDFPLANIDKVFIFPDKKKMKQNYERMRLHAKVIQQKF